MIAYTVFCSSSKILDITIVGRFTLKIEACTLFLRLLFLALGRNLSISIFHFVNYIMLLKDLLLGDVGGAYSPPLIDGRHKRCSTV